MRGRLVVMTFAIFLAAWPAFSGEAEVKAAQGTIDGQIGAFRADDYARAYGFAAPEIQQIFPTVESFMGMVARGYQPVFKPKSYAFGKSQELRGGVVQQVLIVGPDGKDYEAVYTLELQPDGVYRITAVSLREAETLSM